MSIFDTEIIENPPKIEICDLLRVGFKFGKRCDIILTKRNWYRDRLFAIFYPKGSLFEGKKLRRSLFIYWLNGKKQYIRDINKYDFEITMDCIQREMRNE
jgi:hypothetical protein